MKTGKKYSLLRKITVILLALIMLLQQVEPALPAIARAESSSGEDTPAAAESLSGFMRRFGEDREEYLPGDEEFALDYLTRLTEEKLLEAPAELLLGPLPENTEEDDPLREKLLLSTGLFAFYTQLKEELPAQEGQDASQAETASQSAETESPSQPAETEAPSQVSETEKASQPVETEASSQVSETENVSQPAETESPSQQAETENAPAAEAERKTITIAGTYDPESGDLQNREEEEPFFGYLAAVLMPLTEEEKAQEESGQEKEPFKLVLDPLFDYEKQDAEREEAGEVLSEKEQKALEEKKENLKSALEEAAALWEAYSENKDKAEEPVLIFSTFTGDAEKELFAVLPLSHEALTGFVNIPPQEQPEEPLADPEEPGQEEPAQEDPVQEGPVVEPVINENTQDNEGGSNPGEGGSNPGEGENPYDPDDPTNIKDPNWQIGLEIFLQGSDTPQPTVTWDVPGTVHYSENALNTLTQRISYKNNSPARAFAPGELSITIPYLGGHSIASQDTAVQLQFYREIGANDATHIGYQWNYTIDRENGNIIFTNAEAIDEATTFEGTIEIRYSLRSTKEYGSAGYWPNDYNNNKVSDPYKYPERFEDSCEHELTKSFTATLSDGDREVSSDPRVFNFHREYLHPWKRREATVTKDLSEISHVEGIPLPDGADPTDYYWVRYTFRYDPYYLSTDYPWIGISDITMRDEFKDDVLLFRKTSNSSSGSFERIDAASGNNTYVIGRRIDSEGNYFTYNVYRMSSNYTSSDGLWAAYPKSEYGNPTTSNPKLHIENRVELWGRYDDRTDPEYLDDDTRQLDLYEHQFHYPPGHYRIDKYEQTRRRSHQYTVMRYQNITAAGETNEMWRTAGWQVNPRLTYPGFPVTYEIADDYLFATSEDGTQRQLEDDDFYFYQIIYPGQNDYDSYGAQRFTNQAGFYHKDGSYDVELFIRRAGESDFDFTTPYATFKNGSKTFTFSEEDHVVAYCFRMHDLKESISGGAIYATTRFKKPELIPHEGTMYNACYLKAYSKGENGELIWENAHGTEVVSGDSTYSTYTGLADTLLKEKDLAKHGYLLRRSMDWKKWIDYAPIAPSMGVGVSKWDPADDLIVQDESREEFRSYYKISGKMYGWTWYEADYYTPELIRSLPEYAEAAGRPAPYIQGLEFFDILPDGVELRSTAEEIKQSIINGGIRFKGTLFFDLEGNQVPTETIRQWIIDNLTVTVEKVPNPSTNPVNPTRDRVKISADLSEHPLYIFYTSYGGSSYYTSPYYYNSSTETNDSSTSNNWIRLDARMNYAVPYERLMTDLGSTFTNRVFLKDFYPDGNDGNSSITKYNSSTDAEDADRDGSSSDYMSYDSVISAVTPIVSSHMELRKSISSELSGGFVTGTVMSKAFRDYVYRIKLRTGAAKSANLIIYDSLEDQAKDSEYQFINAYGRDIHWQGMLQGVDTSEAENRGYRVKVWYAETNQPTDFVKTPEQQIAFTPVNGSSSVNNPGGVWKEYVEGVTDKTKVRALAFEFLDPATGKAAVVPGDSVLWVDVTMKAQPRVEGDLNDPEYRAAYDELISTFPDSAVKAYNGSWSRWNTLSTDESQIIEGVDGLSSNIVRVIVNDRVERKVRKVWNEPEDAWVYGHDHNDVVAVKVELIRDGRYYSDIWLSDANEWSFTFTDLPKYNPWDPNGIYDGNYGESVYTVKEVAYRTADGVEHSGVPTYYKFSVREHEEGFDLSAHNTLFELEILKQWQDKNPSFRPDSVFVNIYRNGVIYEDEIHGRLENVELKASEDWRKVYYPLEPYDENGNEYVWSVEEVNPVSGYTDSYVYPSGVGLLFDEQFRTESVSYDWVEIFYRLEGSVYSLGKWGGTSLAGEVIHVPSRDFWVYWRTDGSNCSYYGFKIKEVYPAYYAAVTAGTETTLPSDATEYHENPSSLPESLPHGNYGDNKRILWHYTLGAPSGGPSGPQVSDEPGDGRTIVLNKLDPATLSIHKTVTGNDVNPAKQFDFHIKLQSFGHPVTGAVNYITTRDNGTHTITFDENGVGTVKLRHDETVTLLDLPKGVQYIVYEADYSGEHYRTTSEGITGTPASGEGGTDSFATLSEDRTVSFNNHRSSLEGKKIWKDNNDRYHVRPDSVTVKLYRDTAAAGVFDTEPLAVSTASKDSGWEYGFHDLEEFAPDGRRYTYIVKEDPVPAGYSLHYEKYNALELRFGSFQTPGSSDSLRIYYVWDGEVYLFGRYYGTSGNSLNHKNVVVPSGEVYLYWETDGSSDNYFGFELLDIQDVHMNDLRPMGSRASLPEGLEAEDFDTTALPVESLQHYAYGNNVKKLWHFHSDLHTGNPEQTSDEPRVDYDTLVNTLPTGNLEISKRITGWNIDPDKQFDIYVYFSWNGAPLAGDKSGSDRYIPYTMTYADGRTYSSTLYLYNYDAEYTQVSFSLKHGESIRFDDLPAGVKFKVEEKNYEAEHYYTGYASGGAAVDLTETPHTLTAEESYQLEVLNDHRTVEGQKIWNDDGDAFHIRPSSIWVDLYRDGVKIDEQEAKSPDWKYAFDNLPEYDPQDPTHRYVYTVKERVRAHGYDEPVYQAQGVTAVTFGKFATVNSSDYLRIYFYSKENKYWYYRDFYGRSGEYDNQTFYFPSDEIYIYWSTDYTSDGYYGFEIAEIKGYLADALALENGNMLLSKGNIYGSSKPGISGDIRELNASQLPESQHWEPGSESEQNQNPEDYHYGHGVMTWWHYDSGYKPADNTETGWHGVDLQSDVPLQHYNTIINNIGKADLSISKEITGRAIDTTKSFDVKITFRYPDAEGTPQPMNGQIRYTLTNTESGANEGSGYSYLNSNGRMTVSVKHGQTVNIKSLPLGTSFTIEEADYSNQYYHTKYYNEAGEEVDLTTEFYEVSRDEHYKLKIVNEHRVIEGQKIWNDNSNRYNIRPSEIQIELLQTVPGGETVSYEIKTVKATDNWKYAFDNLPKTDPATGLDYIYSIREVAQSHGYDAPVYKADTVAEITFGNVSITYYDVLYIYYRYNNAWRYKSYGYSEGSNLSGKTIKLPTDEFYIRWKTDSSNNRAYGFIVDDVHFYYAGDARYNGFLIPAEGSGTTLSIPAEADMREDNSADWPESRHWEPGSEAEQNQDPSNYNYGNDQDTWWHYTCELNGLSVYSDTPDQYHMTVENNLPAGDLKISKEITGWNIDTTKSFTVYVWFSFPAPPQEGEAEPSEPGEPGGDPAAEQEYLPMTGRFSYTRIFPNGSTSSESVTLSEAEGTKGRAALSLKHGETIHFKDLPVGTRYWIEEYDYSGQNYIVSYVVDGAEKTLTADNPAEMDIEDHLVEIKNDHRNLEGKKIWNDNNNKYNIRPQSIEIALLQDGQPYTYPGETEPATQRISADTGWKYDFGNLPKDDGAGHEYIYTIREVTQSPGYDSPVYKADKVTAITFEKISTVNSYDSLYIFYQLDGYWYYKTYYGTSSEMASGGTVTIPTDDFYIYWRTDSSSDSNYGFKISEIKGYYATDPALGGYLFPRGSGWGNSISYMNRDAFQPELNAETLPESRHYNPGEEGGSTYHYGNNVERWWHYDKNASFAAGPDIWTPDPDGQEAQNPPRYFLNPVNNQPTGELSFTKTVTGWNIDTEKYFNVRVYLSFNGQAVIPPWYVSAILENMADGSRTSTSAYFNKFDDTWGYANYTIRHGQRIILTDLPVGMSYRVVENSYSQEGYSTSYTVGAAEYNPDEARTIALDDTTQVDIVNDRRAIEGYKVWNDNNNQYRVRPDSITIKLMQSLPGQEPVEYERKTISGGEWKYFFVGMPYADEHGTPYIYTIEEVPSSVGYETPVYKASAVTAISFENFDTYDSGDSLYIYYRVGNYWRYQYFYGKDSKKPADTVYIPSDEVYIRWVTNGSYDERYGFKISNIQGCLASDPRFNGMLVPLGEAHGYSKPSTIPREIEDVNSVILPESQHYNPGEEGGSTYHYGNGVDRWWHYNSNYKPGDGSGWDGKDIYSAAPGEGFLIVENNLPTGDLSFEKEVTGWNIDTEKYFDVNVYFRWQGKAAPVGYNYPYTRTSADGVSTSSSSAYTYNDNGWARATVSLKHGEKITFHNLPAGMEYRVVEKDYSGQDNIYITTYSGDPAQDSAEKDVHKLVHITNDHRAIEGDKIWNDNNDRYHVRPKEITVQLYRDGEPYLRNGEPVTQVVKAEHNWHYGFGDLLEFDPEDGHRYVYTIKEVGTSTGYEDPLYRADAVTAIYFEDFGTYNGSDYLYIYFQVGGNWYYRYYYGTGDNKAPGVVYIPSDDFYLRWYSDSSNNTGYGFEIEKIQGFYAYDPVILANKTLIPKGTSTSTPSIPSEGVITNSSDLPKTEHNNYAGSQSIWWHYTRDYQPADGTGWTNVPLEWEPDTNNPRPAGDAPEHFLIVENTLPTGDLSIRKEITGWDINPDNYFDVYVYFSWQGEPLAKNERPSSSGRSIPFVRERGGSSSSDSVYLTDYDEEYTRAAIRIRHDETITFKDLPVGLVYRIEEKDYTGEYYHVDYSHIQTEGSIARGLTAGTIINDHRVIEGAKIWDDSNNGIKVRPETVEIELFQNGVPYIYPGEEEPATRVIGPDNWHYAFDLLPYADENGVPYAYSVREKTVPDPYELSYHHTKAVTAVTFERLSSEENYDYVYFCYQINGSWYYKRFSGSTPSGRTVYLPSSDIYIKWHTDGSADEYYGFKLTGIRGLLPDDPELEGMLISLGTETTDSNHIPPQGAIPLNSETLPESRHWAPGNEGGSYSYGNGQRVWWHYNEDYRPAADPENPANAGWTGKDGSTSLEPKQYFLTVKNSLKTGGLTIEKLVSGTDQLPGEEFTIHLKLTRNGAPLSGKVQYNSNLNETVRTANLNDEGVAALTIKDQEIIRVLNLPEGTVYEVTEDDFHHSQQHFFPTITHHDGTKTIQKDDLDQVTIGNYKNTVEGYKHWLDDGNKWKLRPDSITIELLQNGQPFTYPGETEPATYAASKDNNYYYGFYNLPMTTPSGEEANYSIREVVPAGYEDSYTVENGIQIRFGDFDLKSSSSYVRVYYKNRGQWYLYGEYRYSQLKDTTLLMPGSEAAIYYYQYYSTSPMEVSFVGPGKMRYFTVQGSEASLNLSGGNVLVDAETLPSGAAIPNNTYTERWWHFTEKYINSRLTESDEPAAGHNEAWNTLPAGELKVSKAIDGLGEHLAEFEITLELTWQGEPYVGTVPYYTSRDGEETLHELLLTAQDNGRLVYMLRAGEELRFPDMPEGMSFKVTEKDYSDIHYTTTVTATGPDGHVTKLETPAPGAEGDIVRDKVTAVHFENYRHSVEGQKRWIDDHDNANGTRPESIKVILYQNGQPYVYPDGSKAEQVVSEANEWKYAFHDLPYRDGSGNPYEYVVKEDPVPAGYTYLGDATAFQGTNTAITFGPVFDTENNCDWLDIYYRYEGELYYKRYMDRRGTAGNVGGETVIIPSSEIWFHWRTDGSVTGEGWEIVDIRPTNAQGISGTKTSSLPSYTPREVVISNSSTYPKVESNYGHGVNRMWKLEHRAFMVDLYNKLEYGSLEIEKTLIGRHDEADRRFELKMRFTLGDHPLTGELAYTTTKDSDPHTLTLDQNGVGILTIGADEKITFPSLPRDAVVTVAEEDLSAEHFHVTYTYTGPELPAGYVPVPDVTPAATEPSEPSNPTDPTDPTEPSEPSEPSEPTDPTEPSEPTDPTDPSEPTEPAEPTDPADPADPAEPAEPEKQWTNPQTAVIGSGQTSSVGITNDKREIKGEKQWHDDEEDVWKTRPESITLDLLRKLSTEEDEAYTVADTVTTTAGENWAWAFYDMPLTDENGVKYDYIVRERAVPHYTQQMAVQTELTFHNRYEMESNSSEYDYVQIFYRFQGVLYTTKKYLDGALSGKTLIIPSDDVYVYFRTDGSQTRWGFEITDIKWRNTWPLAEHPEGSSPVAGGQLPTKAPNGTTPIIYYEDFEGLPKSAHYYSDNENHMWHLKVGDVLAGVGAVGPDQVDLPVPESGDMTVRNRLKKGELSLKKIVTGAQDPSITWNFTLMLQNPVARTVEEVNPETGEKEEKTVTENVLINGSFPFVKTNEAGDVLAQGSAELVNGEYRFSLKHGETILFKDLPDGFTYLFTEEHGGTLPRTTNAAGTVTGDALTEALFENWAYNLPSSGGPGTYLFTILGTMFLGLAAGYGFNLKKKKEEAA